MVAGAPVNKIVVEFSVSMHEADAAQSVPVVVHQQLHTEGVAVHFFFGRPQSELDQVNVGVLCQGIVIKEATVHSLVLTPLAGAGLRHSMHGEEVCDLFFPVNFVLNDPGPHHFVLRQKVVEDLILAHLVPKRVLLLLSVMKLVNLVQIFLGHQAYAADYFDCLLVRQAVLLLEIFQRLGGRDVAILYLRELDWVDKFVHVVRGSEGGGHCVARSVHG